MDGGDEPGPGFRKLLERTEARHRGAATRLHGMGWEDPGP
jgi:hypothetical protein